MRAHTDRTPRRPAEWSCSRLFDRALVEAWTRRTKRRSADRLIDGTEWYGYTAAVDGTVVALSPFAYRSPDTALAAVAALFAPKLEARRVHAEDRD